MVGACVAGGTCGRGCTWQGAIHDRGHAWQGAYVVDICGRVGMASYWNAFLLRNMFYSILFYLFSIFPFIFCTKLEFSLNGTGIR